MNTTTTHGAEDAFAGSIWRRVMGVPGRVRAANRNRREHAALLAMSSHELRDIGLCRGDVAFGVSSGRGVFRDID
ncbi:DUF1127 domain-containing protein [Hoeflea sp. WL0058]|uniref:DUF1127 domain-containing protein n=1 Tax=Flavimaribacter sediminis TaxID=2865987 RepID=A0AAE2ZJ25_9HYPH|nr:DUF1127 domain-containing protein [Flavimaribacter sediminis]MBW8637639.1 DUF1127 domain-containing protein [Flavimaribacter sediminis]